MPLLVTPKRIQQRKAMMHSKTVMTNGKTWKPFRTWRSNGWIGWVGLDWGGGIISRCERFSCLTLDRWKIAMMILDYLPINPRDSYNNSLASSWFGVMTYENVWKIFKRHQQIAHSFQPQGVLGVQVSCALTVSFFCSASLNSA